MIKKLGILFLLSLAAGWLSAQSTAVTALVTDTDGTNWYGGSWKIAFVPNSANPNIGVYNIGGTPLSNSVLFQSGVMDSGGNLGFTIYQSTAISPANSSWQLTVCPQSTASCGVYNFSTSTTTLNISSVLTTIIPPPRFNPLSGTYGYTDGEAIIQLKPGSTYWNVGSLVYRCYNGTSWGACGTGGGGTGITALTQDVTASGTGSVAATVVGLRTKPIPSLTTGFLFYDGTNLNWEAAPSFTFPNSTVQTGNYAANTCQQFIQINNTSAATVTLPAVVVPGCYWYIERESTSTNVVTINPNGVTYTGVTTVPIGQTVFVTTDGTNYVSSYPIIPGLHVDSTPSSAGYVFNVALPWSCQPGLGDGLNTISTATYLSSTCLNTTGSTITLNSIKCFSDNSGTSTMNVTNSTNTALLTGPITCSPSFAPGTQSGTVTLASGDYLKFTFAADGTSTQSTWVVSGVY